MNPPPGCAVCGISGVTLYHDRASGQKRCRQHRSLPACAECGVAGVTLHVESGRALCQVCRTNGSEGPALADWSEGAAGELVSPTDPARDNLAALRASAPLDRHGQAVDYRPRAGPACVTLELQLDDQDLQALQAMRLGEPLYKAAQSVGLTNNGLKVHLGRAVIDAWLGRAA